METFCIKRVQIPQDEDEKCITFSEIKILSDVKMLPEQHVVKGLLR